MATSGVLQTTTTAKIIIQEALELIGALGEGELANSAQETSLLRTLRNMCTTWQAAGLNLFAVQSLTFFLEPGKARYKLPGDVVTDEYTRHRTTSTAVTGATSIQIDGNPDPLLNGVGVVLEGTNTLHLSIVTGISQNTVDLDTPLPGNVAEGASVFLLKYDEVRQQRFMKALHGSYVDFSGYSIPMDQLSRNEYDDLTRKDSTGVPLQFYVDIQATTSELFIWPTPTSPDQTVRLDVQRQLDTLTDVNQDVAFPAEWFLPLATNLAYVSSAKYGLPPDDTRRLRDLAAQQYEMAEEFDFEWGTSVYFTPDSRGG